MSKTIFTRQLESKQMLVEREFGGSIDKVWQAWTDPNILDQWWAPKPWKAKTKKMNFSEGGSWLYCMVGPTDEAHWAKIEYLTIKTQDYFSAVDYFCDEIGNIIQDFPKMQWVNSFTEAGIGTKVSIQITFESLDDLQKITEMGFVEGFTAAHENLDQILAKK